MAVQQQLRVQFDKHSRLIKNYVHIRNIFAFLTPREITNESRKNAVAQLQSI